MAKFTVLDGAPFALIALYEPAEGDGQLVVYNGKAVIKGNDLYIDFGSDKPLFEIYPEWYERIKPVKDRDIKDIVRGADYYLSLSLGDIVDGDYSGLIETGLTWPLK